MPKARQPSSKRSAMLKERPSAEAAVPTPPPAASEPPATAQPKIVSMHEASMAYVGEWVLFHITSQDQQNGELYGEVLAHSPSRRVISKAHKRAYTADPKIYVAIMLGGTRRVTKEEFNAMIDEAMTKPYVNVNW